MTPVPLPRGPRPPGRQFLRFFAFLLVLYGLMALPGLSSAAGQDPLAVGSDLPDFELESLEGETYGAASVADGTALIVVFFRGAW